MKRVRGAPNRHSRVGGTSAQREGRPKDGPEGVSAASNPAAACRLAWIPAYAGMTVEPGMTAASCATEPAWVRRALIAVALLFLSLFLFVPLAAVFVEAFKKGWGVYLAAITEADAWSAIKLTLLTAA